MKGLVVTGLYYDSWQVFFVILDLGESMKKWFWVSVTILLSVLVGGGILIYSAFQDETVLLMPLEAIPQKSADYFNSPNNGFTALVDYLKALDQKGYKSRHDYIERWLDELKKVDPEQSTKLSEANHLFTDMESTAAFSVPLNELRLANPEVLEAFLSFNRFEYFADPDWVCGPWRDEGPSILQMFFCDLCQDLMALIQLEAVEGSPEKLGTQLINLYEILDKIDLTSSNVLEYTLIVKKQVLDGLDSLLTAEGLTASEKQRFSKLLKNRLPKAKLLESAFYQDYAFMMCSVEDDQMKRDFTDKIPWPSFKKIRTLNVYFTYSSILKEQLLNSKEIPKAWRQYPDKYPGSVIDQWTNPVGHYLVTTSLDDWHWIARIKDTLTEFETICEEMEGQLATGKSEQ